MIRQAHTYLVGAMGGATLIAIAIAVFVVLVSAQVFRDWPIAGLGNHGEGAAEISDSQPAAGGGAATATAATKAPAGRGRSDGGHRAGTDARGDLAAAGGIAGTQPGGRHDDAGGRSETGAGDETGTQGGGTIPASSPQAPGSSGSGGGGSASSGGGSGSGLLPVGKGGGGGSSNPATSSPTGQVTETVNDTVNQVDEAALGGALNETGVTGVTEGVVNGVVGPESTVGKVVDETVGAVGGLLHPNR